MPIEAFPYAFPEQNSKKRDLEADLFVSKVAEDISLILAKGEYKGHIEVPVRPLNKEAVWRTAGVVLLVDVPEES